MKMLWYIICYKDNETSVNGPSFPCIEELWNIGRIQIKIPRSCLITKQTTGKQSSITTEHNNWQCPKVVGITI